jgi:uncharacterized protein YfkK (UPF0435 family)
LSYSNNPPTFDDPDYERLKHIYNTVRKNGAPLSWSEIRKQVAEENKVLAKWA